MVPALVRHAEGLSGVFARQGLEGVVRIIFLAFKTACSRVVYAAKNVAFRPTIGETHGPRANVVFSMQVIRNIVFHIVKFHAKGLRNHMSGALAAAISSLRDKMVVWNKAAW